MKPRETLEQKRLRRQKKEEAQDQRNTLMGSYLFYMSAGNPSSDRDATWARFKNFNFHCGTYFVEKKIRNQTSWLRKSRKNEKLC